MIKMLYSLAFTIAKIKNSTCLALAVKLIDILIGCFGPLLGHVTGGHHIHAGITGW